jgi:flavin reductase (DIM6/NTAB) family NADH-FMN oxidoreductase RutF
VKRADFSETEAFWKRPERVVLATSLKPNGRGNIIALGWKMRTSFTPPIFAVSVGKTRYSHELILDAGEFVLAFPGESSAKDVLYCGTHSGRTVDKFAVTGFTPLEGSIVRPPIIKECVANFECRLTGTLFTGDHTIFAGEVVACWLSDSHERIIVSVGKGSGYLPLARGADHTLGIVV